MTSPVVCVIVTKDRADLAFGVTMQLLSQSLEPGLVVVVDASRPSEFERLSAKYEALERNAKVLHLRAHAPSLTGQRNQGIEAVLAEQSWQFLQFMDDDVSFGPDYLQTAMLAMVQGGWSGLCGATDEAKSTRDASLFERAFALTPPSPGRISSSGRNAGYSFDPFVDEPRAGDWVLGCSMYSREAVESQRFWVQPGYVLYEDAEFSSRLVRRGRAIAWLPSLRLQHLELSRTEAAHKQDAYQSVFNRAKLLNSSGRSVGLAYWWSVVGLVGRALLGTIGGRKAARNRLMGYAGAVKDVCREFYRVA